MSRNKHQYPRPDTGTIPHARVMVFSDARRVTDYGQLCYVTGILLDGLVIGSIFHTLSWSSRKIKRPVKSTGAAEILAAGEAIDEGKVLHDALQLILATKIDLWIAVDRKELYTSFSTQMNSIDKSIRADVNIIRFDFETKAINRMFWIPGRCNLSDPGTRQDSPLRDTLNLTLQTGHIPIEFPTMESRSSDSPLG